MIGGTHGELFVFERLRVVSEIQARLGGDFVRLRQKRRLWEVGQESLRQPAALGRGVLSKQGVEGHPLARIPNLVEDARCLTGGDRLVKRSPLRGAGLRAQT